MLGHNFPVYIGFRGGKGAAVMTGLSLVVVPYLTLLSVPALLLGYVIFRSAFWAMMMTFISINILTIVTGQPTAQVALCIALTLLVGSTHLLRAFRLLWPAIKTLDFHRIGEIE
jgi:glycerol-3-phosphate acyltransferase PlsY